MIAVERSRDTAIFVEPELIRKSCSSGISRILPCISSPATCSSSITQMSRWLPSCPKTVKCILRSLIFWVLLESSFLRFMSHSPSVERNWNALRFLYFSLSTIVSKTIFSRADSITIWNFVIAMWRTISTTRASCSLMRWLTIRLCGSSFVVTFLLLVRWISP